MTLTFETELEMKKLIKKYGIDNVTRAFIGYCDANSDANRRAKRIFVEYGWK